MDKSDDWIFSASEHPELLDLLNDPKSFSTMSSHPFLSSTSANAVISDLRPTTLSPLALDHINLFLDELLETLLTAAQSLNPRDLRSTGVPSVFSGAQPGESTGIKALGRAAVAEAEVEVRSWYESNPGPKTGFPPSNVGRGMTGSREASKAKFPLELAVNLLRIKCAAFSTYAPNPPPSDDEVDEVVAAWKSAGGDDTEGTIEIAGLWMTGVLEHICEHVLQQIGQVVARDSSTNVAHVQDLYTAIAEDEGVWGFFRRLKVKDSLEEAVRVADAPKVKRGTPNRPTHNDLQERFSPSNASPHASRVSLGGAGTPPGARRSSIDSTRKITGSPGLDSGRGSSETSRFSAIAHVTRKGSSMTKRFATGHDRKDSGLSVNTRSMYNAYNEAFDTEDGSGRSRSPQEEEDEFDALVRSGETMKVSLTPSRLRTFDSAPKRGQDGQQGVNRRTPAESIPTEATPPLPTSDTVPSLSHSTSASLSEISRDSPIRHTPTPRSAPGSAGKLQPRAAKTIEEGTEDDNAGAYNKKESLKEIFSSAPGESTAVPAQKRTVPAVVLGGPPPGSVLSPSVDQAASTAPEFAPTLPRKNSVNRLAEPEEDDQLVTPVHTPAPSLNRPNGTRAARSTEARELAEFFNSTPPPPTSTKRTPTSEQSAKGSKGFRGLMSKVTGGNSNKKREEEKRLARENQIMEIPTAPSPNLARRQRSMASVMSSQTAPRPMNYGNGSGLEGVAPAPPKGVLRKRSDTAQIAGAAATAAAMAVGAGAVATFPSEERSNTSTPRTTPPLPSQAQLPRASPSLDRDPSEGRPGRLNGDYAPPLQTVRKAPPPPLPEKQQLDEGFQPSQSVSNGEHTREPVHESLNATQIPSSAMPRMSGVASAAPLPPTSNAAGPPVAIASRPAQSQRTPTIASASSFTTADEGDEEGEVDEPEDSASAVATNTVVPEPTQDKPIEDHVPAHSGPQQEQEHEPSIPLSRLSALRGLLQHATSVSECRLLLSAILTQLGVPLDSSEAQPDGETRVIAWLLAGSDGPPVDPQPKTAALPSKDHAKEPVDQTGEEEGTPKPLHSALVDSPVRPQRNEGETPDGVEGLPEDLISEAGSAISTVEEGTTGFAQAGQRSSPFRLSRAV